MKITRILHSAANVSADPEAAASFYRDVLGMGASDRPEIPGVGGWWFRAGDGQIHLIDAARAPAGVDPTGPHFCLGVADLDEAIAELDERDIPYLRATQGPREIVQVFITDPAGNTIELQQDRPLD
jgi:catechol 2,3-dioxygenase-like lactoylglutathione lyase family enzyme